MKPRNEKKEQSLIGNMNISGGQVNIVGEGSINQYYNSGPARELTRENLAALLHELKTALERADLDRDTKGAVRGDLQAAMEQAQKTQPQPGLILNRLKSALDLVTSLGGAVAAAKSLAPLLQQAFDFAQKLFAR